MDPSTSGGLWVFVVAFLPERDYIRYVRVFAVANPSVVCLSVTLVHPTQGVEISGNVSTPSCTLDIRDLHAKFDGDRPRGSRTSAVKRKRGIEK